jgi:hypothetical protein
MDRGKRRETRCIEDEIPKEDMEELEEYIQYLKTHPDKIAEMWIGYKLHWWQKLYLRSLSKIENIKYKNCIRFKNDSVIYCIPTRNTIRGIKSELIGFYCSSCGEVHENYPISDTQFIGELYQMCKESYEKILKPYINEERSHYG